MCYSPDEMYYFAPKNPQNNKSSIVGQYLDAEIFEDFLNTTPVNKIIFKILSSNNYFDLIILILNR